MAVRSSTGARIPGVFRKTGASFCEPEPRGRRKPSSQGQVNPGQQSSSAEPYEG